MRVYKLQTVIVRRRETSLCLLAVLLLLCAAVHTFAQPAANRSNDRVGFRTVSVNGKNVSLRRNGSINLGSSPQNIFFDFGPTNELSAPGMRVRYRLEGEDAAWRDGPGEMLLAVRFYNSAGDQIGQNTFKVTGESA